MGEVLQKVLMPWLSQAVGEQGYHYVGGPVTRLADIRHLGTARDLVTAYELNQSAAFVDDPAFVDVVRFEVEPLMRLRAPEMLQRPWPTYPMGFLSGHSSGPVPVWVLDRTRVPRGAEMWRVHRSGEQEMLTRFEGIARGWRSARGFMPMTHLVGPRAEFEGREYAAEFTEPTGGQVELVHFGEDVPPGFEPVRPMVSARTVLSAQCEQVHEVVLSAQWLGVDARILQPTSQDALLLLEQPDVDAIERTRAREVEPGYYEVVAPKSELAHGGGVSNVLQ
ncbi:hypothetical protein [Janibacter anophelis]|uniref:hypothetical protein n=1 Tax=Janibacter anophelis TaxID=319054 RepID=UPI00082FC5B3|nr:hypothetical protein [Janibacter anophelis]